MYYKLWYHAKLSGFSVCEKHTIINLAVKKSRVDHPLNVKKRLLILSTVALLPSVLLYLFVNFDAALIWSLLTTAVLNIKDANAETPTIEPYMDSAILEFKK